MNRPELQIARRSATLGQFTGPLAPNEEQQVSKLIDLSRCIGCKACQSACVEWNQLETETGVNVGVYDNPADLSAHTWTLMRFAEWDNPKTGDLEWLIRKDGCMHCADPGCLKACPAPGAIVQYTNGIVDFVHENCIGCGYCVKGCPFDIPRISEKTAKSYKCTLCIDRYPAGQEPACAKACPTEAITYGNKSDRIAYAATRIEDLKSRGFENAGLYNPQGVGGTHVMYVLHHADKPEIYHGLPGEDVRISSVVGFWKGLYKYAGMGFLALVGLVTTAHYMIVGPDRVTRENEEEGRRIKENG